MAWYAIFLHQKNSPQKWVYAKYPGQPADLHPVIATRFLTEELYKYIYNYPSIELAIKTAKHVIPKEALKKHHLYISEKEPDGYRAILEIVDY